MSPVATRTPKTFPLPANPADLPIGTRVVIARPRFPSESNPPGRTGVVVATHPGDPDSGKGTPRMLVWILVDEWPSPHWHKGQWTPKLAEELDLVVGGGA